MVSECASVPEVHLHIICYIEKVVIFSHVISSKCCLLRGSRNFTSLETLLMGNAISLTISVSW